MKYTIEQINEAWTQYNRPMYLVNKEEIDLRVIQGQISAGIVPEGVRMLETQKRDFISYLIGFYTKEKTNGVSSKRKQSKKRVAGKRGR